MDFDDFSRKAGKVADKVGEEGEGVVDALKSNKKTFLIALAVVVVALVVLANL